MQPSLSPRLAFPQACHATGIARWSRAAAAPAMLGYEDDDCEEEGEEDWLGEEEE